jgi:hypothetical protein
VNWLEFVASIVGSLAWPLVFLGAFYFLRKPVKDLLPFLQRFKYKDLEVEFNRRVEEISAEVSELPAPQPAAAPQADEVATFARVAESSPRAAVLEAWLSVESAAFEAAKRFGWQSPSAKASSGSYAIKFLEQNPALDRSTTGLLRELRSLRNQAVHTPDFALSKGAALEYVSTASRVANYLRSFG